MAQIVFAEISLDLRPTSMRLRPVSGRLALAAWLVSATTVSAQLIAPGQPIPRTSKPPVVFVNGYQNNCGNSSFASTFASADTVLQANGEASVFFDNCTVAGTPSIEQLGAAFGNFLSSLKFNDGTAVSTVDVVAHSMGGLIVRSYLSGKQDTEGQFGPAGRDPYSQAGLFRDTAFRESRCRARAGHEPSTG